MGRQAAPTVAIVVTFLNEAEFLPVLLRTMAAQTAPPERLLLVDDGSADGSLELAQAFAAEHAWATALSRPVRPASTDRLAAAPELRSFLWAVEQLRDDVDVIAKMDADLELRPSLVVTIRATLAADPRLGLVGVFLSIPTPDGGTVREATPPQHVRGATKFYRRACLDAISPIPAVLGWDTADELRAAAAGWTVRSVELPDGDCVHLRPTGAYDGRLRAFRRWGRCAWGYGAHPLWVAAGAAARARQRPYVLGGLHYLYGWASAGLRRAPRVEPETRAFGQARQLRQLRRLGRG